MAISDLYREGYTHGGVPNLFFDAQYIAVQGGPGAAGVNTDPMLLEETLAAKLGQSAVGTISFDYLERPNDDAFYRDRSPIYNADKIEVPALILGGWRDGLLRGAPEMFQRLSQRPGVETRLYVDPCTHKGCGAPLAPMTSAKDLYDSGALVFEFLSKHLAGAKTPDRPKVEYYVQGRDEYAQAELVAARRRGHRAAGAGAGRARRRRPRRNRHPVVRHRPGRPASAWRSTASARSPRAPYVPTRPAPRGPTRA